MMEGEFKIRVTYAMRGRLVMLSHLEVARALERAVRRADLPFAVTQGFSPHMKLAFGAALPVGVGGDHEIFDVTMTEYVDPDEALRRLQDASPYDLMPESVEYITREVKAASVAYPFGTYRAVFDGPVDGLQVPDSITVIRKKKEKQLRPADFLVGALEKNGNEMLFTLEAKPSGSLRPDVLVNAMLDGAEDGLVNTDLGAARSDTRLHVVSLMRIAQRAE
ncbi:Uncharacterized protein conserved in bacteria [Slackia heliotrinireducens]|uniref:Uncharacterized conserved protein (DUF2344) n=1 Tax=Slackia heliotrinireducens (strain ATCC 29202 / DSM 20476 / NCTC 11029 / RHS 1) TaxID=471855 RepID=C7N6A2_SLAHD|nr:TIGR03936 family radical SAM-associated protein [Slackia heliotrinireducens]ACV22437.1 uncharacterized conserved protein (DUF2344) [Slackia heliotrinireducens DSM 20476]VEH00787.1 Uncharacterized protein conserved in bacteria [Slackia heliotrinireducens]